VKAVIENEVITLLPIGNKPGDNDPNYNNCKCLVICHLMKYAGNNVIIWVVTREVEPSRPFTDEKVFYLGYNFMQYKHYMAKNAIISMFIIICILFV